jgi:hypothetical protein
VIPQVFVFVACWSLKPFPMLTAQGRNGWA